MNDQDYVPWPVARRDLEHRARDLAESERRAGLSVQDSALLMRYRMGYTDLTLVDECAEPHAEPTTAYLDEMREIYEKRGFSTRQDRDSLGYPTLVIEWPAPADPSRITLSIERSTLSAAPRRK